MRWCSNHSTLIVVIFMLSTIVGVTDCCSSRILLSKEHTLKIVQEQLEQRLQQQQLSDDIEAINSSSTSVEPDYSSTSEEPLLQQLGLEELYELGATDGTWSLESFAALSSSSVEQLSTTTTESSEGYLEGFTEPQAAPATPTIRPAPLLPDELKKYELIDIYYTLFRELLSADCDGEFSTQFCMNGGRCFRYPVRNHSFFSCECADGFVGERCESKSPSGLYATMPTMRTAAKPKILTARVMFSYPMLLAISTIYIIFGALIVIKSVPKPQFESGRRNRAAGMLVACA